MIDVEQNRALCKTHTIRLMDYSMECGRNYNNKYITVLYFCLKYVKKMREKKGKETTTQDKEICVPLCLCCTVRRAIH